MRALPLRTLTWNLYHGRDRPPDPALFTWRSRLLRVTESNATHLQVNRDLERDFTAVLNAADWDIALLQECPPRWADALARATRAEAHRVLTSRNSLAALRSLLARLNPDLIASNEGGSNLTLVRGRVVDRSELELTHGPRPERRALALTRTICAALGTEVCVANLHASAGAALRAHAEAEVLRAAGVAVGWARGTPLVFGGDLNLRPRESDVFDTLEREFGLRSATAPDALDHVLVLGLRVTDPPAPWPPTRREVVVAGRAIRLSDHAPVTATFAK
jgi:endonuclease/exonuclease/phosphatase family metal-dependent hydrolase